MSVTDPWLAAATKAGVLDAPLLRLLHVEDNPSDALLTEERLRAVRPVDFDRVARLAEIRDRAEFDYDCVLLDLTLPDAGGVDIVDIVRRSFPDVAIVVLTGLDDTTTGVDALRRGAQDYLAKNRADGATLDRAVRYAMERVRLERLLARQALHDPLTDLPNRTLFGDRLAMAVERMRRNGRPFALLMLDLDHFKDVNDTLGHARGDDLLVEAARRLRSVLRPTDTLCRLGGDEFTVVCEDIDGPEDAGLLADRLADSLVPPFDLGPQQVHVGVTIGIAFADARCTPEGLLRDADTALYAAKNAGRGRVAWFSDELHVAAEDRFAMENALREALLTGRGFGVAYQRIVHTGTGETMGIEALARWTHPERGPVPPSFFIPLAEATGLVTALDMFVMEQALDELVRRRARTPGLGLSINLSGQTLGSSRFEQEITERVRSRQVPFANVTLEILESALLTPGATEIVSRLRRTGFRIALDDFGAGVSSLNHFVTLSADVLKIDRSFLASAAGGNQRAVTLLRLIVGAGTELDMTVVAEGVEGQAELDVCRRLGVERAQGFLWGRV